MSEGPQGEVGMGLIDIVTGFAEWVRGYRPQHVSVEKGVMVPAQSPLGEEEKKAESPHMDDVAKGEVYICFEGPLGAHLLQDLERGVR